MATQMKQTEDTNYPKDPTNLFTAEALALNMGGTTEADRLIQLCTGAIGGILLVTKLLCQDGIDQPAFITVLAAPYVATYAQG
jgi:hypothetical protein